MCLTFPRLRHTILALEYSHEISHRRETACGLIPITIDQGELDRMHGIDERISLDNLCLGTRVV